MSDQPTEQMGADERRLAEMGYKQELSRSWSGFQNFAISFTIISVLAGCFTTYYQAWNNGGPGRDLMGLAADLDLHPHHRLLHGRARLGLSDGRRHLLVGRRSSAGPAGAGSPGWFNLLGLIAIVASVDYFAGQFLRVILGLYNVDIFGINFADADPNTALKQTFLLFFLHPHPARDREHRGQPPGRHVQRHLRVLARRSAWRSSSAS